VWLNLLLTPPYEMAIALGVLLVTLPAGIYEMISYRRSSLMDYYFSTYLFSVARAIRGGSPVVKAFVVASEGEYGPLKPVLRAFVSRLTLGVPLQSALLALSNSLKSKISNYAVSSIRDLLNLTPRMDVFLDELGTFQSQYVELQRKRESETKIHVIIIYVSFLTFLLAVGATVKITPYSTGTIPLFSTTGSISPSLFKSMSFYVAFSESVFLGLLAGEINKGKVSAGLIHVAAMAAILLVFSYLMLFGRSRVQRSSEKRVCSSTVHVSCGA